MPSSSIQSLTTYPSHNSTPCIALYCYNNSHIYFCQTKFGKFGANNRQHIGYAISGKLFLVFLNLYFYQSLFACCISLLLGFLLSAPPKFGTILALIVYPSFNTSQKLRHLTDGNGDNYLACHRHCPVGFVHILNLICIHNKGLMAAEKRRTKF